MAEAPVVKLDADGEVVQCAKGLGSGECGYTPGAKVCGKCGAVAQQMKSASVGGMMGMGGGPAGMPVATPMRKKPRPMGPPSLDDEEDDDLVGMEGMDEDEDMMDDEDDMMDSEDGKMMGYDDIDDDESEMYVRRAAPKRKRGVVAMEDADMEEDMMEEEDDMEDSMMAARQKMRNRRLGSMGYKSSEFDKDAFLCSFDRKVYPGGSPVCDSCPGGCVPEEGMPSLLEVEGMAEDMFKGKVLDSGYSDEADLFVVDIERKDGKPVEIFFDGSSGEVMGWHLLNSDLVEVKSALVNKAMISFGDAADIAVKTVTGDIVAVEPDVFEGYDVYAVEIDGINGKSYDVFVSLDGEVLGYDEYTMEEATEIEAEAAEIALKRAYSEDTRKAMADKGQALPDGSFPIADEADLRNAIQAFGRAKDKTAAKAHIMKRAVAMGKEDLIPVSWVSKEDMDKAKAQEKSADDNFLSTLMEFEMLTVAEDTEIDSEQ